MLDVRPSHWVRPLKEQPLDDLRPLVHVENLGDEDCIVTGLVRIYRQSTDKLVFGSVLLPTRVAGYQSADIQTESEWSPAAPADHDYFLICEITAVDNLERNTYLSTLGPRFFDIKPGPMGPAPAAHHQTHERGGMDEIEVEDLATDEFVNTKYLRADGAGGLVFDTPLVAAAAVENLTTTENDTDLRLAPDGAGGVSWAAGGTSSSETPQTLTDGANIDWDLALGGAADVTPAGNRTMNAPTHMVNGARYRLKVTQDGTGTRLLTWTAAYRFPGGVDPTLSAGIGEIDIIYFDCDGTHLDCVGMVSALA